MRTSRRALLAGGIASVAMAADANARTLLRRYGPGTNTLGPRTSGGGASFDMNVITGGGVADPRMTFTRAAGGATFFDATGTNVLAAANQPRIDYGPTPGGVTNWIRNSVAAGSTPGTPGTPPTNWAPGIATAVSGSGTEGGLPYVDFQFAGTGVQAFAMLFEAVNAIPVTPGQVWTMGVNGRMVAGSMANVTSINPTIRYYTSAGVFVSQNLTIPFVPTNAALATQRTILTDTVPATAAFAVPAIRVAANGAVDITIRMAAPQLEQGSVASAWVPTSGAAANSGAVPIGLLIEESRVQSIRNPRAEGSTPGVVGSGGVMPTNWSASSGSGITTNVIGVGTESGVPFLDIQIVGTSTAPINPAIGFETTTSVAALSGQTWSCSLYARVVGGSLANITSTVLQINENSNVGGGLISSNVAFTPAAASLASQRVVITRVLNNAATAFVAPFLVAAIPTGVAVNCTLRICPQLEQGSFPTSLILPAVGAPAATTRGVELASVSLAGIYNPLVGAVAVNFMIPVLIPPAAAGFPRLAEFSDGTTANTMPLLWSPGSSQEQLGVTYATVAGATAVVNQAMVAGAHAKLAGSWGATTHTLASNMSGALVATNTVGGAGPVGIVQATIGNRPDGLRPFSGYIERVRFWRRALSNAEMQAATT